MNKEYRIMKCEQGYVVTQHHCYSSALGPDVYGTMWGFATWDAAIAFIESKFCGDKAYDEQSEGV